jgi:hypothetical protein
MTLSAHMRRTSLWLCCAWSCRAELPSSCVCPELDTVSWPEQVSRGTPPLSLITEQDRICFIGIQIHTVLNGIHPCSGRVAFIRPMLHTTRNSETAKDRKTYDGDSASARGTALAPTRHGRGPSWPTLPRVPPRPGRREPFDSDARGARVWRGTASESLLPCHCFRVT